MGETQDFFSSHGKLVELEYQLKGDKSRNDSTYNRDSYRVLISKEIHDLINTSGNNGFAEDVKSTIETGFLKTSGKGRSGIKPMDHSEKVNGYVVAEVKLRGGKKIKLGGVGNPIEMGDIRLCGVLKDGIFLITAFSQHGENNEELTATVQKIAQDVQNGKIQINSRELPSSSMSSIGVGTLAPKSSAKKK